MVAPHAFPAGCAWAPPAWTRRSSLHRQRRLPRAVFTRRSQYLQILLGEWCGWKKEEAPPSPSLLLSTSQSILLLLPLSLLDRSILLLLPLSHLPPLRPLVSPSSSSLLSSSSIIPSPVSLTSQQQQERRTGRDGTERNGTGQPGTDGTRPCLRFAVPPNSLDKNGSLRGVGRSAGRLPSARRCGSRTAALAKAETAIQWDGLALLTFLQLLGRSAHLGVSDPGGGRPPG